MPLDQHPIPREALPPGWGPVELGEKRFVYRRSTPPIELVAVCTTAETHPALGIGRCWELRYRYAVGEHTATESLGQVSTKRAAADALVDYMKRIRDAVDPNADPVDVRATLDCVSLSDPIPEPRPSIE